MKKPNLLYAPRNHEVAIGKKLLVFRRLVALSHWINKLELIERKTKQLLLEDTITVKDSFYG
jgi:hypothetical protein